MTKKGYNKRQLAFATTQVLLLGLFMCIVSCQRDDTDLHDGRFKILPVFHQQGTHITTRAYIDLNNDGNPDYTEYEPVVNDTIYAWAQEHTSGTTTSPGVFRYYNSRWFSNVEVESGKQYYMFAFNPGGISSESGSFTFNQQTSQARLTVNSINVITLGDPSISVAAAKTEWQDQQAAYTDPTPVPGSFNLGTISAKFKRDKVLLAMNHLYSRAQLSFTLDTTYSKLRTIVITDVKIVAAKSISSMTYNFTDFTVTFNTTYSGDTLKLDLPLPNDSIVLNATNTTAWNETTSLFENYVYRTAGDFCFLPQSDLPLSLQVTYNVYAGIDPLTPQNYNERLVRKNQKATNSAIKFHGGTNPEAGTSYPVKINVKPSYLYQLSDDDLDIKLTIE